MLLGDNVFSFHKSFSLDNALDFSKRSSFMQEIILEKVYPTRIILPMKQHYGEPCVPTVEVGEHVLIGQCVGMPAPGAFSSPVHSGISGTVTEIKDVRLPNGTACKAVCIESDRKRTFHPSVYPRVDVGVSGSAVMGIVRDAGIVGMGGEGIPSIAKMIRAKKTGVKELLVNCLQSEPYASSDFYRITESAEYIVMGAVALAGAMNIKKITFLISNKHKNEIAVIQNAMQLTAHRYSGYSFNVKLFEERYPQGYYRLIARALYGKEISENESLEETCGAVLFNSSTVYACWEAIADNIPLVSRVVTVTTEHGHSHNVLAPIGTPVSELLNTINGVSNTNKRIVWGNAFTGITIQDPDNTPIIKTTSGISVYERREFVKSSCIHCGKCAENCPMNLNPSLLYHLIDSGLKDDAESYNASKCFSCGACSYVCPSGLTLTQTVAAFSYSLRNIPAEFSASTEKIDIGAVSLLEVYDSVQSDIEDYDSDSFVLPFEGGKKV